MLQAHTLSQRRIAIAITVLLVTGAVGLTVATGNAQAAVTLDIPDRTFSPDDGEVHAPWLLVEGTYSWSNLGVDPGKYQVFLLIDGPAADGSWQAIAMTEGSTDTREATGDYALRGDITASSEWSTDDFTVGSDGTPQSQTVPVSVLLIVRDGAGDIVADAEAQTTVTVTVEHGGTVVSVDGSGIVAAQDDSGDPTPTYAGGD